MANQPYRKCRPPAPDDRPAAPEFREPPVRRWPHLLTDPGSSGPDAASDALWRILSRQNQLLGELCGLLAQNNALLRQIADSTRGTET